MKIGETIIGHDREPVIIAEAGLNHNGDINAALEMVEVAAECGADIVKFQTFKADQFCRPDDKLYPAFKAAELPDDAWKRLKRRADREGITFLSTPQNRTDLDLLLEAGVQGIKIGSDDFTNLPLIRDYANEGLPMILSCGMSYLIEVQAAMIAASSVPRALLVCTSEYPCPAHHANLGRIRTLRGLYPPDLVPIGFSDHTKGYLAAATAVGLGACVFEKHFTLSHDMVGPDHWFSADPGELREYVKMVRRAYSALGNGTVEPSVAEVQNKARYQRKPGQQLRAG